MKRGRPDRQVSVDGPSDKESLSMANIPIHLIGGNQFIKARTLQLPVVFDGEVFRMPSSSGGEGEHVVRFDSAESPLVYSCTCRAGSMATPCWAAARALDVLTVLSVHNIYVGRPAAAPSPAALPATSGEPLRASIVEGDLALIWGGEDPEAGVLYTISN